MDWKKYSLALKNEENPIVIVYSDNNIELVDTNNTIIYNSEARLISKDILNTLTQYNCTDIYSRIDSGNSLDVRNKEDRLDYVRDYIYFPDLEIGVIDSEDFLELKYNNLEDSTTIICALTKYKNTLPILVTEPIRCLKMNIVLRY